MLSSRGHAAMAWPSCGIAMNFCILCKKDGDLFHFMYSYLYNQNKDDNILIHKRQQVAIKFWTYYIPWSLYVLCLSLMFSTRVICSGGVFKTCISLSSSCAQVIVWTMQTIWPTWLINRFEQPGKEFKKPILRKRIQFYKETKQASCQQISGMRSEIL